MLGATVYIVVCSAKNRTRRWLRRVREPRYLIGAVAGIAYFSLVLFGRGRATRDSSTRRRSREVSALMPALGPLGPALGGLGLALMAGLSWALPMASSLFEFTDAETAFLMPA